MNNYHPPIAIKENMDPLQGKKLRIGIISPYSFETPGGVQLHIRDFAEQLIHHGHHVEVLAPGKLTSDMPEWLQTTGSSFSIPYNGSVANLSYFGSTGRKVRKWVDQGQFDIIHLHEPEVPSLSHKPLLQKSLPCPLISTFHASFDTYPLALKLTQPYLRFLLRNVKHAICVSEAAYETAEHYLSSNLKVDIIPNGINVDFFAQAKTNQEWMGTKGSPTIGFLGRMGEERKGFRVYAKAALCLLEHYPQARFLCAGDGQDSARLIARSVSPNLEKHFEFLGRISDQEKAAFYKSLDIFVAPQTGGESFGIVLAEAMAAGCPIVASDLPAFTAVSEGGKSARHFSNGNGEACAQEIERLLTDDETRISIAREAEVRAQSYDWSQVTERVLKVYAQTLNK